MSVEGLQDLSLAFGNLFSKVIPDHHHTIVKKIAVEAFVHAVRKTPVDTGRARANWSVTVSRPHGSELSGIDKQPFDTPPKDGSRMAAIVAANGSQPRDTIYITNSLPYILALEEGHSKQGAHMVGLTVNEIKHNYGI